MENVRVAEEMRDNPLMAGKLEGMQEVSDDFGIFVAKLFTDMQQKKGVVASAKMIAARIAVEREPIQKQVDSGDMSPEEAKARMDQIEKIVRIVEDVERNNRGDIGLIQGRIEGVKMAGDLVEKRFKGEVVKFERHKRMFEDEDDLHAAPAAEEESPQEEEEAATTEEEPLQEEEEAATTEEEPLQEEEEASPADEESPQEEVATADEEPPEEQPEDGNGRKPPRKRKGGRSKKR